MKRTQTSSKRQVRFHSSALWVAGSLAGLESAAPFVRVAALLFTFTTGSRQIHY